MTQLKITKRQKEIIIGKLLGDGHLESVNNGKTYKLKIEHSLKQKAYVDWMYTELKDLATSEPKMSTREMNDTIYYKYGFNTKTSSSLRFYGQQFYSNRKKVIPKLIHRWLTPLAFAVWFMDDGSIKSKECQGKILNTQGFDDVSLTRLIQALQYKYEMDAHVRNQKDGKQIYIPAHEISKLRKIIGDFVLPSMSYKLG